jgi:DNA-binding winged helix-turn-helix (wHTH) protein/tetratricopeptide (TPR) repeat protein
MSPKGCYRFGEFVLQPSTRLLHRRGDVVAVPAKVFDCIAYLVEHRDRAVGRDELASAVWGRVDVSDGVLNQTMLAARRALGAGGREQRPIRTVIGFGYHWVDPVDIVEAAPQPSLPPRQPPREAMAAATTGPARRIGMFAVLGVAVICVVAWFAWRLHTTPAPGERGERHGVVVLPVATSGEADSAWLRLGLMDLVAERLRTDGATVVPSDTVVALARAFDTSDADDLARLADAAGADVVIASRATREGDGWLVEVRTVHGRASPRTARGHGRDALEAGVAAADAIAAELGLRGSAPAATADLPMRELLQRIQAATLGDRLDEARTLAARATDAQRRDPEFAFRLAKIDAQAGRVDEAARALRALLGRVGAEHDPRLHARILDALGVIALQRGDAAEAEALHGRSIALLRAGGDEGQLGKSYADRASARFALGRDDDALGDVAQARAAFENAGDRLSLVVLDGNLGAIDLQRGRYREALPLLEEAAKRFETMRIHYAALNEWDAAAQAYLMLRETGAAGRIAPILARLGERVADPRLRFGTGLTRVEILVAMGALRAARTLLDELRATYAREAPAELAGRADAIAARLALASGDDADAQASAEAASSAPASGDDSREQARNGVVLVRTRLLAGQPIDDAVQRFAARAAQATRSVPRLYVDLAQAMRAGVARDDAAARAAFEQALAGAEATRVPLDLVEVAMAYGEWLIASGDLARAGAVVEKVAPWAKTDYEASLLQTRLYHAARLAPAWASALERTRSLAGERRIPPELATPP